MDANFEKALKITLENWNHMLETGFEEKFNDEFMSSFYKLIDIVRDWVNELEDRPSTVEELSEHSTIREIYKKLPEELHMNIQTQLELIIDGIEEMDI